MQSRAGHCAADDAMRAANVKREKQKKKKKRKISLAFLCTATAYKKSQEICVFEGIFGHYSTVFVYK